MAKLIDVYRGDKSMVYRRQLPIAFEESLVMVVDLHSMDLMFDSPLVRGKELDNFVRKCKILSPAEFKAAFEVPNKDVLNIVHHTIPCVGCRRSVERLYAQLMDTGYEALHPIIVTPEGVLTVTPGLSAQELCTLLHDHSTRLKLLMENQARSKKSLRCSLHSIDTQRLRQVNLPWSEIWESMEQSCRDEVVQIHADSLNNTMENYLHKHRFCTECRNKVVKAFNILVDDINSKEKGYNRALYKEVRKCEFDKHLHLPADTDYITSLITRAEPELMGSYSRRERHAKTLEIAQEEVLTCLGICVFERLHRVNLRIEEEECTCKVFTAIVIDALSRNFEMAVEKKKGISQVELLLAKEDQAKAKRKQNKKQKRRKKKDRRSEEQARSDNIKVEADELDEIGDTCYCDESKVINGEHRCAKCICEQQAASLKIGMKNYGKNKSKENEHNVDNPIIKHYRTEPDKVKLLEKLKTDCCADPSKRANGNCHCAACILQQSTIKSVVGCKSKPKNNLSNLIDPINNINSLKNPVNILSPTCESCQKIPHIHHNDDMEEAQPMQNGWSSSEHSQDCGYSSENNNGGCDSASGTSSQISSPYGSEIACTEGFCNHDRGDCNTEINQSETQEEHDRSSELVGFPLSLQQLLDKQDDEEEDNNYIPIELVQEFQSRANVDKRREQLRETLRKNFDQLCNSKPCIRMRKCE